MFRYQCTQLYSLSKVAFRKFRAFSILRFRLSTLAFLGKLFLQKGVHIATALAIEAGGGTLQGRIYVGGIDGFHGLGQGVALAVHQQLDEVGGNAFDHIHPRQSHFHGLCGIGGEVERLPKVLVGVALLEVYLREPQTRQ